MKSKVFIRADGSSQIGLGHLVRCLALAHMLEDDFEITFCCKEIPDTIFDELVDNNFNCSKIENEDEFFKQLNDNTIVVLDGYHFNTEYQIQIKIAGSKLVCIDDLHDKEFYADLIINHAPRIKPQDYLAQPYSKFALGLDYALLRPAFLEQVKKKRIVEKVKTVMICFGGSDFKNLTHSALKVALEFTQFIKIIVATGPAYHATDSFKQLVISDSRVECRIALSEQQMLNTMLESDLAIVPASGILLEAICCGCIPIICFYAKNQMEVHSYMNNCLGINSFGNNTDAFQAENLIKQLKSIELINNRSISNICRRMRDSSLNCLQLFNTLSKQ